MRLISPHGSASECPGPPYRRVRRLVTKRAEGTIKRNRARPTPYRGDSGGRAGTVATRWRLAAAAVTFAGTFLLAMPAAAQSPPPPLDHDAWITPDKGLHFSVGFGLAAGGYGAGMGIFGDHWTAAGLGLGAGIGVSAFKEGADAAGLGQASWRDFAWGVVGSVVAVGISLGVELALGP